MDLQVEEALTRLAVARSSELDDLTSQVYLDALADLAPSLVGRACLALSKKPRAEFESALPSVGTIRDLCGELASLDAEQTARQKLLPMPTHSLDEPMYFCPVCLDEPNGWRLFWCSGSGRFRFDGDKPKRFDGIDRQVCSRLTAHPSHTHADRCGCSGTNPVVAEKQRRLRVKREEAS